MDKSIQKIVLGSFFSLSIVLSSSCSKPYNSPYPMFPVNNLNRTQPTPKATPFVYITPRPTETLKPEDKKDVDKALDPDTPSEEPETAIKNPLDIFKSKNLDVRAPAPGGVSFSSPLYIDVRYDKLLKGDLLKKYIIKLNGHDITAQVKPGPLKDQWIAEVHNLKNEKQTLTFEAADGKSAAYETSFEYNTKKPLDRIVELADASIKRHKVEKMGWDWGEGLLLYSLAKLDEHRGETKYREFIESYYEYHKNKGIPEINWSDRCAPALAALELYRKTDNAEYKVMAEKVVKYLKTAKRTKDGGLNHLGTFFPSNLYPQSMWVDSLMMYNVFAARWGKYMNDPEMTEFAAEQPLLFAKVLQNKDTKLWKHAWFTNRKSAKPKDSTYWLRGNGWAMASIPETIEMLPEDHPKRAELIGVLTSTATSLLPYQSEIGMWYTVLNQPGKIYLESSGTALVSYGMMKGVRKGYLTNNFKQPAEKAFLSLLDRFEQKEDGASMPEISHNTMPYSFLGYSVIPQRNDLAFGLAAMILAGIEYDTK